MGRPEKDKAFSPSVTVRVGYAVTAGHIPADRSSAVALDSLRVPAPFEWPAAPWYLRLLARLYATLAERAYRRTAGREEFHFLQTASGVMQLSWSRIDGLYRALDILLQRHERGEWNEALESERARLFGTLREEQQVVAAMLREQAQAELHLPLDANVVLEEADRLLHEAASRKN